MQIEQSNKSTLNKFLWVVASLFVVAAVVAYYMKYTAEQEYMRVKEELEMRPDMPVEVTYREALMGPGLVILVTNNSDRLLSVIAMFHNPSMNQEKSFRLDLTPGMVKEIGHQEVWAFASGDTVQLTHVEFKPIFMKLP